MPSLDAEDTEEGDSIVLDYTIPYDPQFYRLVGGIKSIRSTNDDESKIIEFELVTEEYGRFAVDMRYNILGKFNEDVPSVSIYRVGYIERICDSVEDVADESGYEVVDHDEDVLKVV